ncbi:hypothetical protein BDV30DRAFT_46954 [Aspergillus minisclerotigenes]|uniref:Uncharacterized protein n=1 Tax=Aspergillus minisclerotigenes TaxID=656917 RepID=A0A5N6JB40_9EURO|nr:hypothetical protein BDV30DRAFT_46954 [Aspergillus minisclerotigenes]
MRRAFIQTLRYDILVPFELLDWTTCKREPIEQYSMANPVREANDWAFQTAIIDIFRILSLWEQNHRLSLDLGLRGRRVGEKPRSKIPHIPVLLGTIDTTLQQDAPMRFHRTGRAYTIMMHLFWHTLHALASFLLPTSGWRSMLWESVDIDTIKYRPVQWHRLSNTVRLSRNST